MVRSALVISRFLSVISRFPEVLRYADIYSLVLEVQRRLRLRSKSKLCIQHHKPANVHQQECNAAQAAYLLVRFDDAVADERQQ